MLSQSKSTLHANQKNAPIKSGGIYVSIAFNRMPQVAMDDVSLTNTYNGAFGFSPYDRLCTYMYWHEQVSRCRTAMALDKNANDITLTCQFIFRGYQGSESYTQKFTDLESFHQFICEHKVIPSKDDADHDCSYFDGEKRVTEKLKDNELFQRYIETHIAHAPALR